MNCRQVHERIEAYHQGTLPEADERGVDIHLVQCPICNEELMEVDTLIDSCRRALAGESVTADTNGLRVGIASLERRAAEQVAQRGWFIRKDSLMRLSFALVVIPAIWVLGLALMHTYTVVSDWEPVPVAGADIVDTNLELPGAAATLR